MRRERLERARVGLGIEDTASGLVSNPLTRLAFGENAAGRPDANRLTLDEISSGDAPAVQVSLIPALEHLGDGWSLLRALWDRVAPDGTLTVRYGGPGAFRMKSASVANLLRLAGFQAVSSHRLGRGREMLARRLPRPCTNLSCTVVVPCRNEIDNVADVVARTPDMGSHLEMIFVDGASTDGTPECIERLIRERPERDVKLLRQAADTGKAGATFHGFAAAQGDVIMILDADMTVRPEDLPRFYLALAEDVTEFANGTRLVYPMERGAMPGLNNLGNRVFSPAMSWLVGSRITDTLCGTKAVLRRDVAGILRARPLFGGHDPWGDFDLLMGAAYLGLGIMDVPIRYAAREAGDSKMKPLSHGVALAQTCLAGARRLKLSRRGRPLGTA